MKPGGYGNAEFSADAIARDSPPWPRISQKMPRAARREFGD